MSLAWTVEKTMCPVVAAWQAVSKAFDPTAPDVTALLVTAGGAAALAITDEVRRAGKGADRAFDGRSMKSQMKQADRSGAAVAVIVGPDEAAAGTAVLRPLRGGGDQVVVDRADLLTTLEAVLS